MRAHLAEADRLFMETTTVPVLDPGRGRIRKGFFWAIACDDRGFGGTDPPMVLFRYASGRSGEHAESFLHGFRGRFLQCDGYDRLKRIERPRDRGCSCIAGAICAIASKARAQHEIPDRGSCGPADRGALCRRHDRTRCFACGPSCCSKGVFRADRRRLETVVRKTAIDCIEAHSKIDKADQLFNCLQQLDRIDSLGILWTSCASL
jgi:hypothetical protein